MGHLTDIENVDTSFELIAADEVPAEIDLGNPRHQDCRNFGICRINFHNRKALNLMPPCCPNRAYGYLRQSGKGGLELIFPKENIAPNTLEKHFGSSWFTIAEAYSLSEDMAQRLGIVGFTFEPGRYPVREVEGRLCVSFD